nr:hypothetical protein [Tanacetum cinerariifolium]
MDGVKEDVLDFVVDLVHIVDPTSRTVSAKTREGMYFPVFFENVLPPEFVVEFVSAAESSVGSLLGSSLSSSDHSPSLFPTTKGSTLELSSISGASSSSSSEDESREYPLKSESISPSVVRLNCHGLQSSRIMASPHCFAIVEKVSEVQSSGGRPEIHSQVARSLMWRSFVHGLRDLNKVRWVVLIRAFAMEVVSGKFRRSVSPPRWVLGVLFVVGDDSGIGGSRELTPNLRSLGELRVVLGVVFVTSYVLLDPR